MPLQQNICRKRFGTQDTFERIALQVCQHVVIKTYLPCKSSVAHITNKVFAASMDDFVVFHRCPISTRIVATLAFEYLRAMLSSNVSFQQGLRAKTSGTLLAFEGISLDVQQLVSVKIAFPCKFAPTNVTRECFLACKGVYILHDNFILL